jgi:hypothetical protein
MVEVSKNLLKPSWIPQPLKMKAVCFFKISAVAKHFWYICFLGLLASVMGGS